MEPAKPPRRPREVAEGLPEAAVRWGFRLLAGREPLNEDELASFRALPSVDAMRRAFTNTGGFHAFFNPTYTLPLFLLRPPATEALELRFEPPQLESPVCQLCTAAQFQEPAFQTILAAMGVRPGRTRALWEQAWIVATLAAQGLVEPGRSGLGIETGRERIAALVAARGVQVRATGTAEAEPRAIEKRRLQLFHPEAVHIEDFDERVTFHPLVPGQVGTLTGESFDFCWSIGLADRLGSVAAMLDLIEASLVPLRPGGLALHTMGFNLSSDTHTWELPGLVLLRRRDIEELAERLASAGHRLLPLNLHPGTTPADEEVAHEVGPVPALRQRHGVAVATSLGLAVRKGG